jgi:hypothetical protein
MSDKALVHAPETLVHFARENALYQYAPATHQVDFTLSPLGLDVTVADDYAIKITLPTAYPHAFTSPATATVSIFAAPACGDAQTEVLAGVALPKLADDSAYEAVIALPAHAALTASACISLVVDNMDMLPLGIPAQAVSVQLRHIPTNSWVPAYALPIPVRPSDPAMIVPSAPTNTHTAVDCTTTYQSCDATFTVTLPAPISVSPSTHIVLQTFFDMSTTCIV